MTVPPMAENVPNMLLSTVDAPPMADAPLATSVVDLGVGGVFLSHGNVQTAPQVRALADGLRALRPGQRLHAVLTGTSVLSAWL